MACGGKGIGYQNRRKAAASQFCESQRARSGNRQVCGGHRGGHVLDEGQGGDSQPTGRDPTFGLLVVKLSRLPDHLKLLVCAQPLEPLHQRDIDAMRALASAEGQYGGPMFLQAEAPSGLRLRNHPQVPPRGISAYEHPIPLPEVQFRLRKGQMDLKGKSGQHPGRHAGKAVLLLDHRRYVKPTRDQHGRSADVSPCSDREGRSESAEDALRLQQAADQRERKLDHRCGHSPLQSDHRDQLQPMTGPGHRVSFDSGPSAQKEEPGVGSSARDLLRDRDRRENMPARPSSGEQHLRSHRATPYDPGGYLFGVLQG